MALELVLLAITLLSASRILRSHLRRESDSEWAQRWGELPQAERHRIARAVRHGNPLAGPEDFELALGYARRERAAVAIWAEPSVAHVVLGATVVLMLALDKPLPVFALTFAILAFLIWVAYRDRIARRNLRRIEAAARVPAPAD